jgi:hypothetical protein
MFADIRKIGLLKNVEEILYKRLLCATNKVTKWKIIVILFVKEKLSQNLGVVVMQDVRFMWILIVEGGTIKFFCDVHAHSFVDEVFSGMLPAHRKMSDYDKYQMSIMSLKMKVFLWRNAIDKDGSLEHLFWCDDTTRKDWAVFRDVLNFDATYKKKYVCLVVVFSGVNHHN